MQNQRQSTIHDNRYKNSVQVLVRARKAAGLSQANLAQKLGLTQPDISKIERLERRLDVSELIDILEVVSNGDRSLFDHIWSEVYACHRKRDPS